MDSSFFRKGAGRTACALALGGSMVLPLLPAQAADALAPLSWVTPAVSDAQVTAEQAIPLATEQVAPAPVGAQPAEDNTPASTDLVELDTDGIDMSQPTVTIKGDYISSKTSDTVPPRVALVRADDVKSVSPESPSIHTPYSYASAYLGLYGHTDKVTLVDGLYHHSFELTIDTSVLNSSTKYQLIVENVQRQEESTVLYSSPIELKNTEQSTSISVGSQKLATGNNDSWITVGLKNYAQFTHAQVDVELISYESADGYRASDGEPTVLSRVSGSTDNERISLKYNAYDVLYSKAHYIRVIVRDAQGQVLDSRSEYVPAASPDAHASITEFSRDDKGELKLTLRVTGLEGYRQSRFIGFSGSISSEKNAATGIAFFLEVPITRHEDGTIDATISQPSSSFSADDTYLVSLSAYTTFRSENIAQANARFTLDGAVEDNESHRVFLDSSTIDMAQPKVTLSGTYREDPKRMNDGFKVVLYDVDEFAAIEYGEPRAYAEGTFTRIEENSQLGDLYSFSIEVDTSTVDPSKNYNVGFLVYEGHGYTAMYGYAPVELVNAPTQPVPPEPTPEPKPEKRAPKLTAESTHLQQYGYNTFTFEIADAADYSDGANFVKFQLVGTAPDGTERTFLSDGLTLPSVDSDGRALAIYHFENSDVLPGYTYRLQVQLVHGGYHSEPVTTASFDLVAPESEAYATELAWAQKHRVIPVHDRVLDPKANVSTADMALALYRASGSPEVQLPTSSPYLDVTADDSEQYRAIVWASQQRLVDAPSGRFHPERAVSRATLAAALYRLDHEVKQPDNSERGYFGTEISWAFEQNLAPLQMTMTEREFGPRLALTRADLAGFLYRWNALHPVFVD
ncbi:MAG: hypothetical protein Q4P78_07585 [Rothia sp. (in: high G+C Gram-positive bacteria)]|uniref:hypothetical protein n=1 Tax=Rothia sp. (in: high G+C Gram-positive bacteria) TaxID=1885016 RepID=UPI0026DF4A42|nr:hypothetical protein [Rothia sp. (in: high G+C Gram-positive bacteria)]MDO5751039.1 hypothetical protein [Rothia sp. (in: high G+C Gram-positive bacteria)]